jgi:kinetochore protein Spc7/SPC105
VIESIKEAADEAIPLLQQEYDEIVRVLKKEGAEAAEIEASDQDYLNELKASIAEQRYHNRFRVLSLLLKILISIEIEELKADVAEGKAKLLGLRERLQEIDTQKRDARVAIGDAQRALHIQKNGTRAEVFRLKGADHLFSAQSLF